VKGSAAPVTGRGSLDDYETLRIPHCLDNLLTDGGEVSLTRHPRSTPQKHFTVIRHGPFHARH
jgi:hypothetical protein